MTQEQKEARYCQFNDLLVQLHEQQKKTGGFTAGYAEMVIRRVAVSYAVGDIPTYEEALQKIILLLARNSESLESRFHDLVKTINPAIVVSSRLIEPAPSAPASALADEPHQG